MLRASILVTLLGCVLVGMAPGARAQGDVQSFRLVGADSVPIVAYWLPRPEKDAPAVLMLHDPGSTYRDWGTLVTPVYRAGFQVLLIDFRGHGASRALDPAIYDQMVQRSTRAYMGMQYDVQAALDWLLHERKVRPQRIALIGGNFAATLAFKAMAANSKLGAMVALCPSNTYFGVSVEEPVKKYGKRPLYVITTKQLLSSGGSQIADMMASNPDFDLKIFPRSELSGIRLLGTTWNLEPLIANWLIKKFDMGS